MSLHTSISTPRTIPSNFASHPTGLRSSDVRTRSELEDDTSLEHVSIPRVDVSNISQNTFPLAMDPQKDSVTMHIELQNTPVEQTTTPDFADCGSEDYSVGFKTYFAIFSLALANCCATLSNTTNTIIKFQVMSVGGSAVASWIANSNFLLTLACGPIFGSLTDRMGKKWFIVGGCAIGVVGSFISSSATQVYTIIGGNILTGIANAGCIVSIAANQEITPNKFRPYAFGFAQTVNSIAAIAGTFGAAAFVKYASWNWSYRLNGIVYGVSGLSVLLSYKPPPPAIRRAGELREILLAVDYLGILLLAGSLASITMALTWGGSTYAWNSGVIIGTLVAGSVGLVIFGLFEHRLKTTNGILDHRLFENMNFPILCFVCLVDGMLLLGINVLYAQEIADLFSKDALRIAVILTPYLITSTVGCLPAGWIMGKTHSYRILLIGALLWCSLFTGLMGLIDSSRLKMALAFSALFGLGTAVTTVIPIVALGLSIPSFLLGTAGTLSISFRALGGIVGITIFTAIYDNKIAVNRPREVSDVVLGAGLSTDTLQKVLKALSGNVPPAVSLSAISALPAKLITPIVNASLKASAESWTYVWVAIACITFANAVACCFLKSVKSNMTAHVESALERSTTRDTQMSKKLKIAI
ncbi:hypothetical protein E4T38_09625 [Aureobasidium subglaciale]|nr:hypothetical protein E4T38_09625 [Aureobasidium subglaciale]KAI5213639.1 hypothetical protein E4T40_09567 [Aureobasidium subglaciale]KAI5215382.1 hypothetical protein E4T41_09605 [Aureobasidium subglaciale]KAI5253296.1 hypothetical protein E4T46_09582 [Aureobasidium subglaciale]